MGGSIVYKWPWENRLNNINRPKTWLPTSRRLHQPKKKYAKELTTAKPKWKIK